MTYSFDIEREAERLAVGDEESKVLIQEALEAAFNHGRRTLVDALSQWLMIKADWSTINPYNFSADVDHSSLLQRILTGGKVYDYPPPRAFSYPWVKLLEAGDEGVTVSFVSIVDSHILYINQGLWHIVQTVKRLEDYIIEHRVEDDKSYWGDYRLTKISDDPVSWHLRPYSQKMKDRKRGA